MTQEELLDRIRRITLRDSHLFESQLLNLVNQHVVEVIEADEAPPYKPGATVRNTLRAKQRKRAGLDKEI